jgi:hypothetical protein
VSLVPSFVDLLQPLSFVMTAPSFNSFVTLLGGWVFARRRTVTGMIVAADAVVAMGGGGGGGKHHASYHRLFAAARWSIDELGLAIFQLLILPLLRDGVVLLGMDDTLARKRGTKIFGVGMHLDPLLSSRRTAITNRGHCWVVLGVICRLPFCGRGEASNRWFCLPILVRLYISRQTATAKRLSYRSKSQLAVEMLQLLCGRFADRQFHAVGDWTYGGGSTVLAKLPGNCDLTSRLKMDARLYDAPPARSARATAAKGMAPKGKGKGGRPRKRGTLLPAPQQMLDKGPCRRLTLDIYARRDKSRISECIARCYAVPARPLKVVAVQPLSGGRKPQAFFSTCVNDTAEQVLTRYAARWSLEVTFHDAKGELGFEQPQGWSKLAVQRTAPMAMLLYSLIVLWFSREGHRHYQPLSRPWYIGKREPSFADMAATLRCQSVKREVLSMHLHGAGSKNVLKCLLRVVRQAA